MMEVVNGEEVRYLRQISKYDKKSKDKINHISLLICFFAKLLFVFNPIVGIISVMKVDCDNILSRASRDKHLMPS